MYMYVWMVEWSDVTSLFVKCKIYKLGLREFERRMCSLKFVVQADNFLLLHKILSFKLTLSRDVRRLVQDKFVGVSQQIAIII
jgi:hypothetical protein